LPGTGELEATVELTASGRRALAEYHAQIGKPSVKKRSPTTPSKKKSRRHARGEKSIIIVADSTDGKTSLICGIDTLPLEQPGMGQILYCIYCGQTFHEVCIVEYMKYSAKCPNPLCPSHELGVPLETRELK
jgi:hypothetical protein